jgi:hypothetical protein
VRHRMRGKTVPLWHKIAACSVRRGLRNSGFFSPAGSGLLVLQWHKDLYHVESVETGLEAVIYIHNIAPLVTAIEWATGTESLRARTRTPPNVTPVHVSNLCQRFSGEAPIHQRFRADNRSSCLCHTFSSAMHRTHCQVLGVSGLHTPCRRAISVIGSDCASCTATCDPITASKKVANVRNWSANNKHFPPEDAWHWRRWVRLHEAGQLEAEYCQQFLTPEHGEEVARDGTCVVDETVADWAKHPRQVSRVPLKRIDSSRVPCSFVGGSAPRTLWPRERHRYHIANGTLGLI